MSSVQVSSNGSYLGQDVFIRKFHLTADEPAELGGNDAGPAPLEWILAGLGSCKSITVKMYAARKGWVLENVSVDLSYEKVGDRHQIQSNLTIEGDLNDEQRQRLLEISNRCPMHKLLTNNVEIQTVLTPKTADEQEQI